MQTKKSLRVKIALVVKDAVNIKGKYYELKKKENH